MRKGFSDLVGIDFSTTATKVVRLRKNKDGISLVGIDLLPAIDFGTTGRRMELPRNICSNYACLAYSGPDSVIRLINAPLPADQDGLPEAKLREMLNVEESFRVGASLVKRGTGRQDSSFLAAALPQDDIRFLLNMFASGSPAPSSVEVAGLAFITAFFHTCGKSVENETVCLLEAGETSCHFAFVNQGNLLLVGKLEVGIRLIREKLAADLGVDDELAASILSDRSINISASLRSVVEPFFKQLSISKDFIERHQSCRISKVFVSGGLSLLPGWSEEVERMLHAKAVPWNPLEKIQCDPDLLPDSIANQATRFSVAIGAAIGGLGEL